jgi:hypothetical protein
MLKQALKHFLTEPKHRAADMLPSPKQLQQEADLDAARLICYQRGLDAKRFVGPAQVLPDGSKVPTERQQRGS